MNNTRQKSVQNEEQLQAITHGEGPLLIIAGAGTGKTTVITHRIQYLIQNQGVLPSQILALTFTEKASHEMEERLDQLLPYGLATVPVGTFHAFCDRVLRQDGFQIGISPDYDILGEAEATMFMKSRLFDLPLPSFRPLGNPNKFINGILTHFSRLKDEDISKDDYDAFVKNFTAHDPAQLELQQQYKELASTYRQFDSEKYKAGYVEYADLISLTLELFRTRPSVLARYRDQYRYVLVDEFQDTNFAQNELAILLAGKSQNLTVVGDDDQAIYRWRGAAISNMLQFQERFPKTKIVVLTKNFRSSDRILGSSYEMIQHNNPDRLEVKAKINKKLKGMRGFIGEPIQLSIHQKVEDEADYVAKEIRQLVETGKYSVTDIALLVRANNHAQPFARAFERLGVPYQFLGPGQLLRQSEVKDLIAYLTLLSLIDDSVACYRVLTMPWLGMVARDVAILTAFAKRNGLSLFSVCELGAKGAVGTVPFADATTPQKLARFVTMVDSHLKKMRELTAGQILYSFFEDTGLLHAFTSSTAGFDSAKAQNIAKFFDRLKSYESSHDDASVSAVVEWLQLSLDMGESPQASGTDWSAANAVTILTVHSSKGLEFPVVFIVNLVNQRFPTIDRKEQIPLSDALVKEVLPEGDHHIEEERRLFYVAMTRARDRLYLTASKFYGDAKREKKISPFVIEAVGEDVVRKAQNVQQTTVSQLSLLDWAPREAVTPNVDVHAPPVTYLSYSQMDSFLTCPLQYKYRYIVKIPVPPSAALVFGDTMHRTVRLFFEEVRVGKLPSMNDLLAIYESQWVSQGFGGQEYEQAMKQRGISLLQGFYQKGYTPGRAPKQLEAPFRIQITPVLKLGGKMDRIDQLEDDKIEIIDYKTGQAPKKKDVTKDLQLTVYALAATDRGGLRRPPEKVIVSFYFFEGQEKISSERSQEQLLAARQEIADVAEKIRHSDFAPTPGKHCDFCEFKLICEAWQ